LSTLTKVLIILLTLSSLFLCGGVVIYVASANNYKQEYEREKGDLQAAKSLYQAKMRAADEQVSDAKRKADEAQQKNTELTAQIAQIQVELNAAKQSSFGYQERLSNMAGVVNGLNQTIASMDQSLTLTRGELDKLRAEEVKNRKELNEVTAALNEKSVQVDALENERKRLLEEKASLDAQLARLGKSGQAAAATTAPVTPEPSGVRMALPATNQVSLKGKIVETDMRNNLVTISLGSADGVRSGMRFHVVRGDTFICDIVITNVDVDRSAGTLELVRQQPQTGDAVSTNL
jgi:peptidoglycan hydrolase CwlO-like protein